MRLLRPLRRLLAALRPRGRGPAGPVTITRYPSPEPAPGCSAYQVRPGLPALPPDHDRPDEQRIRCRLRHLTGEE
jgi:hypothetical protein